MATDPVVPKADARVDPSVEQPATTRNPRVLGRLPADLPSYGLQLAWLLSGMAVGAAVSHVFRWSLAGELVVAVVVGAMTWLGRGLANLALAVVVTLGGVAATYRATMLVFPHEAWDFRWLAPLSLVLLVVAVVVARRYGSTDWRQARPSAALVDLLAGASSLILALVLMHRLGANVPASIVLRAEDNDSWISAMSTLQGPHGVTALTTTMVSTFGSSAVLFFAFLRSATGGLLPGRVVNLQDPTAVISGHVLLVVLCPIVGALVARRTLRFARPLLSLAAWALPTIVLLTYGFTLGWFGFMTAMLAVLLLACAGYVTTTRVDLREARSVAVWLTGALTIYAAGSSWVPLVPLGAVAMFVWYLSVAARPALQRDWSALKLPLLLALPTLLVGLDLFVQYRDVTANNGGSDALLSAPGGAPSFSAEFTVGAFVAVVAGWLLSRRSSQVERPSHRGFWVPLAWLVAYLVAVMLREAWVTKTPAHYGSLKLLFVIVGLAMVFGVAELLTHPAVATGSLDAVAGVAIGVLLLGTIGTNAPIYGSIAGHWPTPVSLPAWSTTVTKLVQGKTRVLCLALTGERDYSPQNYDAYDCSRYAASLQGRDDAAAQAWRHTQLGEQSPVVTLAAFKATADRPWIILIIGNTDPLHSPGRWYAGLVNQPGLTFVHLKT